jgi:hypothetical protein
MTILRLRRKRDINGQLLIEQHEVAFQARLTWNPDDDRFYVDRWQSQWAEWHPAGSHAHWRNATRLMREVVGKLTGDSK